MKNVTAGVAVWFASFELTQDITVPYFGVPMNVLVAVAIGTFCSFAIAKEKIEPRSKMWSTALACFFMGAAFTALVQSIVTHLSPLKMTDALQSGLGAIVAFITRFALPVIADAITTGKWQDFIPFLRRNKE